MTQSHLDCHGYDTTWFVIDVTIWNQAKGKAADSRMRTVTHRLLQLFVCVCPCVRDCVWFVSRCLIHLTCNSNMAELRYKNLEEKRKAAVNSQVPPRVEQ